ncbi:Rad17 cell cycle checkpoint protein-domain-containing protein [Biscogniauxia mediterranea]|nr:Rad17 cell cycle checkpoint protein-domain-containing protein [Biscogniauxia mediterranea]
MAPPAKRRRRNIVHASDDEEESKPQSNTLNNYLLSSPERNDVSFTSSSGAFGNSPSPVRKTSRFVASQPPKPPAKPAAKALRSQSFNSPNGKNGLKSASTSPEKGRSRPAVKTKYEEKGKSADLVTLFSRQAERVATKPSTKLEDIISDPISDDDDVGEHRAVNASKVGQNALKRFRELPQANGASTTVASQKFLRPSRPPRDPGLDNDQRPWSERFGPVNLEELAVHKKKVADVRRWLEDVMGGRMRQRLLILKGAAGTGKTTTVRLLAKDMRCELLEWRNPTGTLGTQQGFQSASAQFEEFMGRGGKFGQLDIGIEGPSPPSSHLNSSDDKTQKIILIEEFPNTFTRSSVALTSFRNTVLQYLATNTPSLATFGRQPSRGPITPVIMVISETLLTTTSASADSFTAHRLLGPEILRHPGTCMIEFNAIAPTLLASALEIIVQKEARKSGRRRTPGPTVLKRLGEIGDIRSAISSLEFLCLKGDLDADWGSKVTFTKPKRGSKNTVALTKGETQSLELVSQREASLGIFHAVGKVVYNKRDELPMNSKTPEGKAEMLPDYLASCSRPKRSEVSVDSLIDETGTDAHTFISALHENYALSCESTGPSDPNSALDYINECIEYLSESDLLCPSWDIFFGGRSSGASGFTGRDSASHMLRQEEITFQVATRGLLFSLPNPVRRIATARRGGGDAYKMFYPTSLKLWREKEELEGIVDHWASTILKGDETGHSLSDGASAFKRPKTPGTSDWITKHASQRNGSQQKKPENGQSQAVPLLSLGSSARREMLLERLPYMAHIARRLKGPAGTARLKEMERVVSFSGIGTATDDDTAADVEGDQVAELGEAWATDKPTEEPSPRKRSAGIRHGRGHGASAVPALPAVQKLVLSDDDIEDD